MQNIPTILQITNQAQKYHTSRSEILMYVLRQCRSYTIAILNTQDAQNKRSTPTQSLMPDAPGVFHNQLGDGTIIDA